MIRSSDLAFLHLFQNAPKDKTAHLKIKPRGTGIFIIPPPSSYWPIHACVERCTKHIIVDKNDNLLGSVWQDESKSIRKQNTLGNGLESMLLITHCRTHKLCKQFQLRIKDKYNDVETYLMANKAWEDNRFRVPDLASGSEISISAIISSISSLLTRPRYLFGVDRRRVGNLERGWRMKYLLSLSLKFFITCPQHVQSLRPQDREEHSE